jgi:hypothetical protein
MMLAAAALALTALVCSSAAEMPLSFYTGIGHSDKKWSSFTTMVNYDAGAAFTESYSDAEHLQRNTQLRTQSFGPGSNGGGLVASINSNVIGKAHIAWMSASPVPDSRGRHTEYARSVEDLVGVFSIEKFVQLWDNSTCGSISTDWMPCV